jgi:hypothetical protein
LQPSIPESPAALRRNARLASVGIRMSRARSGIHGLTSLALTSPDPQASGTVNNVDQPGSKKYLRAKRRSYIDTGRYYGQWVDLPPPGRR